MDQVVIRYFDGCPHWRLADERVRAALQRIGLDSDAVKHERVASDAEAERTGFHGSPTILVDGVDPFPAQGTPAGLTCRIYQTKEGPQGAPTVDELRAALIATRLDAAFPSLTSDERQQARALYRDLARGEPVRAAASSLDSVPGIFRDDAGAVVAFWGLALREMPHRFEVDGRTLYTWCAWDPLFIAPILGRTAHVTTHCPTTGQTITFDATPDGPQNLEPETAVMSFVLPASSSAPTSSSGSATTSGCSRTKMRASAGPPSTRPPSCCRWPRRTGWRSNTSTA
jgi:hypothetical protein